MIYESHLGPVLLVPAPLRVRLAWHGVEQHLCKVPPTYSARDQRLLEGERKETWPNSTRERGTAYMIWAFRVAIAPSRRRESACVMRRSQP